jgi:type IV pilus biogenesis protein CpaD/CtpE
MRSAVLLALLALSACTQDPFDKPGTWSLPPNTASGMGGANDANLRAMIIDPRDLTAGTGEQNSAGTAASIPVQRLIAGRRAPLPQSGISDVRISGDQSGSAGSSGTAPPPQ